MSDIMNGAVHPSPLTRLCNKSAIPIRVLGIALLSACKPKPEPPAAPAPSVPVPEEPKALSANEQFQQTTARAVKLHPELGVAGSPMNQLFLARVKELRAKDGKYFEDKEWPTKLADEIHRARTSRINTPVESIAVAQQPALYVGRWVPISGVLTEAKCDGALGPQGLAKFVLEGEVICEVSKDSLVRLTGADPSVSWDAPSEFRGEQKGKTLVIMRKDKAGRGSLQSWREAAVFEPGRRITMTGQLAVEAGKPVLRSATFYRGGYGVYEGGIP